MSSTPQHSFVILAYLESPYLESCIHSLQRQTIKSTIILATSTPSTFLIETCKKYQLEIRINANPPSIASDWNFALKQAKTPYVTLAHQDDIYLSNYTNCMLEELKDYPNFLIKFSDYQEIINDGNETKIRTWNLNLIVKRLINLFWWPIGEALDGTRDKRNLLLFGSSIPCPSVLYHLPKINDFAFADNFQTNLDWLAWISLAKKSGQFMRSRKILMQHRVHPDSATSRGIKSQQRYREDLYCFNQLWPKTIARVLAKLYSFSWKSNPTL